jgi:hypothetical protein
MNTMRAACFTFLMLASLTRTARASGDAPTPAPLEAKKNEPKVILTDDKLKLKIIVHSGRAVFHTIAGLAQASGTALRSRTRKDFESAASLTRRPFHGGANSSRAGAQNTETISQRAVGSSRAIWACGAS